MCRIWSWADLGSNQILLASGMICVEHITSLHLLKYQFGFLDSKLRITMSSTMPGIVSDAQWKLNKRPSLWQQDWITTWVSFGSVIPTSIAQCVAHRLFTEGKADLMKGARKPWESIQAGECWVSDSDKTLLFGNQNLPAFLPRDMLGSQIELSSSLPISVLFVSVGLRQQNPETAFTS